MDVGQRVGPLEVGPRDRQRHVRRVVRVRARFGAVVLVVAELLEEAPGGDVAGNDRDVDALEVERPEGDGVEHQREAGPQAAPLSGAGGDEDGELGPAPADVAEVGVAGQGAVAEEQEGARAGLPHRGIVRGDVGGGHLGGVRHHHAVVRVVVRIGQRLGRGRHLGRGGLDGGEHRTAHAPLDAHPVARHVGHLYREGGGSVSCSLMNGEHGWSRIEEEARRAFGQSVAFPLPAYSEYMPPPYVGIKPYDPVRADAPATAAAADDASLDITEYEQADELEPGLSRIADHLVHELGKLLHGEPHALSRTLLADNPAWPPELAEAAAQGKLRDHPLAVILPLSLSRTQDDKGNNRWTLFGASHEGPAASFWASFGEGERDRFARLVAWAAGAPDLALDEIRIRGAASEVPAWLHDRLHTGEALLGVRAIFTFCPFAHLPASVRAAYLAGSLLVVPSPASLVLGEHPLYRKLARELPRAMEIPLLHLFPRVQGGYAIRIPQSGWIEEHDPAEHAHGHRIVSHVARTHRWERVLRDEAQSPGDGAFTSRVSVALFSTDPDHLGLYGKPMARNAQIWGESYGLLLDGPSASRSAIEQAARVLDAGGRFGYRFLYPAMRAGGRELTWHLPLCAREDRATGRGEVLREQPPLGHVGAEPVPPDPRAPRITLAPRLLDRPGHREAARLFAHEVGHARRTTTHNARKLLELAELLGHPLPPSFARQLLHVARGTTLEAWLSCVPGAASDRAGGERVAAVLRTTLGPPADPGASITLESAGTRAFEESVWRGIASLAEGAFRGQENADPIPKNEGRTGGPAAEAARLERAQRRDLERLGDHLHARYRELLARHGMEGRAQVVDHVFRWETDFDFSWSEGWSKNQTGEAHERNVVLVIPGKNRAEAVIMGDHYDTAYMEDVYETGRGGDMLRASASGADDNHSATTALLLAADALLPLSREGRLERDVWLVHLTGEEFPADCLGARALARALIEHRLAFTTEAGEPLDVSGTRVVGAFILDMIGHNSERDRDVFQIAVRRGRGIGPPRARGPPRQRALEPGRRVVELRPRAPRQGTRPAHARRRRGAAALRSPGAVGRDPHRVGAALRALQHRRADLLRRGGAGGALHGELRHPPHRLPRHPRHDEEHRPRLLRRAHRHRRRDRRRRGVRAFRVRRCDGERPQGAFFAAARSIPESSSSTALTRGSPGSRACALRYASRASLSWPCCASALPRLIQALPSLSSSLRASRYIAAARPRSPLRWWA